MVWPDPDEPPHHRHRLALVVRIRGRRRHGRHHHGYRWRRKVYVLKPGENKMSDTVTVGHQIDFSIEYVDTNGNPMLTPVTPDSPPTWTNVSGSPDTFTVSADGTTAVLQATGAGSDTVSLSVTVGGVIFTASDLITINAPPQVLGGVDIVSVVV